MWYVVQVMTGNEHQVAALCKESLLNEQEEVFIPMYERKRKVRGDYEIVKAVLFPGYVFFQTEDVEGLFYCLKNVSGLTRILQTGEEFTPLHESEVAFLSRFGGKEHVVEFSVGYIEGDKVVITEGPMADWQGKVKKIDRHKRIAVLEVEFFGRITDVTVGLEIVEKRV
ncbi:MAG: antiterminator LoaP [Lachnospiraceae bacterium]|nr:antiterminator LoaP [Lachnospiraceae bacterium]